MPLTRHPGGLALGGDIYAEIDPEDKGALGWADRGAAGINGTLAVIDLATGTIPGVGEAAFVATGLWLGGGYLYHHWTPFRDVANDVGHAAVSGRAAPGMPSPAFSEPPGRQEDHRVSRCGHRRPRQADVTSTAALLDQAAAGHTVYLATLSVADLCALGAMQPSLIDAGAWAWWAGASRASGHHQTTR